jgi:hypothetical protein
MGTCMVGHAYVKGSHFTFTFHISYSRSHSHSHSRSCSHLTKVNPATSMQPVRADNTVLGGALVFVVVGGPHATFTVVFTALIPCMCKCISWVPLQVRRWDSRSTAAAASSAWASTARDQQGPCTGVRRNSRPPGPPSRPRYPGPALRSLP